MKLSLCCGLWPVKDMTASFSNICSTVLWFTLSLAVKRDVTDEVKKDSFKAILIKLQDQWTVKQVRFPVGLCHWFAVEPLVWMCFPNGWAESTSEWQCFSSRFIQPQKCKLCWTLKNKVSHCPRENSISICKESIFDSNLYFNCDS